MEYKSVFISDNYELSETGKKKLYGWDVEINGERKYLGNAELLKLLLKLDNLNYRNLVSVEYSSVEVQTLCEGMILGYCAACEYLLAMWR